MRGGRSFDMYGSVDVARAAIKIALTGSRQSEEQLIQKLKEREFYGAAVDVGGSINETIHIVIERAIVASRKCGVTRESHISD